MLFVTFLSLMAFQLGRAGPPAPPLATPMVKHPIAKIDLQFLKCFVLILGMPLQRHLRNAMKYPSKKVFKNPAFVLLLQPEFPEKGGNLPNWIGHMMLVEG